VTCPSNTAATIDRRRTGWFARAALVGLALASAGCALGERAMARRYLSGAEKIRNRSLAINYNSHGPDDGPAVVMSHAEVRAAVAKSCTCGNVTVRFPDGLDESCAERMAELWDAAVRGVGAGTGLPTSCTLEICLIHLERKPRTFRARVAQTDAATGIPLPFVGRPASAEAILSDPFSRTMPYIIVHEMVEMRLMMPDQSPTVLPDMGLSYGLLRWRHVYHTRWFRDGFANYAGYLAVRTLVAEAGDAWPENVSATDMVSHDRPLSSLARVGTSLFRWKQDDDSQSNLRYNAALGLFLLLERRFGPGAIRGIVAGIPSLGYPDGPALEDLAGRVIGKDLRRLVADFTFPDLGLVPETKEGKGLSVASVKSGSPAGAAGVRQGDVVRAVDGRSVANDLDYELALLDAAEDGRPDVVLTLDRCGEAVEVAVELPGRSAAAR
jgi:hypothetical protein